MDDNMKLAQAKATFATLCRALDKEEWSYQKDEEKLSVKAGAQGEDLPIDLGFQVDAKRMLVKLYSPIPFTIPEDNRLDIAIAVTAINDILANGCFDFDLSDGSLLFRIINSFLDTQLGEEVFVYMLYTACQTVDTYNDLLLMLSKKVITLEQFLDKLNDDQK